MPSFDICWLCDGTGKRCLISGAKCCECNGTGFAEERDDEYEFDDYDQYEREDGDTHA